MSGYHKRDMFVNFYYDEKNAVVVMVEEGSLQLMLAV